MGLYEKLSKLPESTMFADLVRFSKRFLDKYYFIPKLIILKNEIVE